MTRRDVLPRGPRWPLLILLARAIASLVACATRKPSGTGSSTLTLAHINDTHGRYLPVAVSPGNATAQTGDPGREDESFPVAARSAALRRWPPRSRRCASARAPATCCCCTAAIPSAMTCWAI